MNIFKKLFNKKKFFYDERLVDVPFLKKLKPRELGLFNRMLYKRNFKKGEIIFKKDYPNVVLYFLMKGTVQILLNNEKSIVISELEPYSFFGELGMYIDTKRSASVVSKTDTELYAVSKDEFKHFVDTFPKIGVKILYALGQNMSKDIIKSNERLKECESKLKDKMSNDRRIQD